MDQKSLFEKYTNEPAKRPPDAQRKSLGFHDATDADLEHLQAQKKAILLYLRHAWRTNREIIIHTGATSALRRVRELRADGFQIEKQASSESGRHVQYRWNGKRSKQDASSIT